MGIAADVYAEELSSYNHGYPLWSPEPAGQYEIRVGDVGHIDEDGQFHRLFNVTVGPDHPYNAHGVPADFVPLQFNQRLLHVKPDQFPPGPIPSKGVKSHEIDGNISANPSGVVGAGLSYKFDCSKNQGAILVLRDSAKKTLVPPAVGFSNYMRKHHDSWYAYATDPGTYGLTCKPEDIILVRGSVKTTSWALGAYIENGNHAHDLSFNGQVGPIANAGFKLSSSNQSSAKFEHRIGPSDTQSLHEVPSGRRAIAAGKAATKKYDTELPEIVVERSKGIDASIDAGNLDNQCVFLGYYKIKYRLFNFKKIAAAAGPHTLPDGEDPTLSPAVLVDADPMIEAVPGLRKCHTPIDDVLEYILEYSNAQIAIASDGDVEELLQDGEFPDDFRQYLRDYTPKIDVDENGTGTLSVEEHIGRSHRRAATHAEARALEQLAEQQMEMQYQQAALATAQAPPNAEVEGPSQEQHAPASSAQEPPLQTPDAPQVPPDMALVHTAFPISDPNSTGSNMAIKGSLLLPKRGPNASSIPWLHAMLMDKDAEGGSVTDMSMCEKENGRFVATGCEDCAVRVWDLETGALTAKLEHHEDTVWTVAFSPDGTKIVSGGADQKGVLWDVEDRQPIAELLGHEGDVWTLAYSPNGKFIATGSVDRTVRLWDGRDGRSLAQLPDHSAVVMMVKFSPDSMRLASCGDNVGHIWDIMSGTMLAKLEGHKGIIWDLDFAPDSTRVVTAAEDYTARVWNTETGEELCTLREHAGPVWAVAFSPDDGREIASGSYDCLLAICDSFTGEQHHILGQENPSIINTVSYSKDGDLIAAGGADGNVRFWDTKSGQLVGEFQGHDDKVKKVVFSPDGNKIISSSDDGTLRIWSVQDVLRL